MDDTPETTTTETQTAAPAAEAAPEKAKSPSKITRWMGNFVLGGALLMVIGVLLMATLARYDIIGKLAGFGPFYLSKFPSMALLAIGIIGLVIAFMRKTGGTWKLGLGTVLSGGMLYALYSMLIWPAGAVPPIHDISTDLNEPPQFATLDVAEISTGSLSVEEHLAYHQEAYGDIGPIVIDKAPETVLADAQALAEDRGWDIASYDAAAGKLEATATAGYVRFYDDVLVEVTPVADGSTRVDMRSVSRVGQSDVGYNAARIEAFLSDLRAAD